MVTTCGTPPLRPSVARVLADVCGKYARGLVAMAGCAAILLWSATIQAQLDASSVSRRNVALYYQSDVPVDELRAFDVVVIDPSRAGPPSLADASQTTWLARLRVVPSAITSDYMERVVAPLWTQGYRGFLVDDGQPLGAAEENEGQALRQLVAAIKQAYPDAGIVLRNHLALAGEIAGQLDALVVDSIYNSASAYGGTRLSAARSGKDAARDALKVLRDRHPALQIVALDYCYQGDRVCRRERARQIEADGWTPYVTTAAIDSIGVGHIEIMPRKILMVQALEEDEPLLTSTGAYTMSMPLNYLGYDVHYADANKRLPTRVNNDRYAGIVVALQNAVTDATAWRRWLLSQIRGGTKVVFMGQFGFTLDGPTARELSLRIIPGPNVASDAYVASQDPIIGFEVMPAADARAVVGIEAGPEATSLLRVGVGKRQYDVVGLAPWGGFALAPYHMHLDTVDQYRWPLQPLEFYRRALALPDMPVPDVTSENGRRLMFTQVDGDGFASRGEFAGATNQYSGQILYDRVFKRYPIPMTVSVIEGETSATGAYPKLSSQLEAIAVKIFSLPHVEIGSHTYSHPFFWTEIDGESGARRPINERFRLSGNDKYPFHLPIAGYELDVAREVQGSIDYINNRLAPPGKKVQAFLWSGDAMPSASVLRRVAQAGVFNINGGDTTITRQAPSWTKIAGYGLAHGTGPHEFQVFAATMNENVYTGDWTGPFYGYRRVLETFEMTDTPIRFKALDIYYHFYSATKKAALDALTRVFDSSLKQPVFPVYTTDYIRRVLEWRRAVVAREGDAWLVRTGDNLRQLRWPGNGVPRMDTAQGLAGYMPGPGGLYIHMGARQARFSMSGPDRNALPYIHTASGFVRDFSREGGSVRFDFGGYYQPFILLANAANCRVAVNGKHASAPVKNGLRRISVGGNAVPSINYHSVEVNCG
jgi:hypothetical protein